MVKTSASYKYLRKSPCELNSRLLRCTFDILDKTHIRTGELSLPASAARVKPNRQHYVSSSQLLLAVVQGILI